MKIILNKQICLILALVCIVLPIDAKMIMGKLYLRIENKTIFDIEISYRGITYFIRPDIPLQSRIIKSGQSLVFGEEILAQYHKAQAEFRI